MHLILRLQEKDGNKDLAVPGAGVHLFHLFISYDLLIVFKVLCSWLICVVSEYNTALGASASFWHLLLC